MNTHLRPGGKAFHQARKPLSLNRNVVIVTPIIGKQKKPECWEMMTLMKAPNKSVAVIRISHEPGKHPKSISDFDQVSLREGPSDSANHPVKWPVFVSKRMVNVDRREIPIRLLVRNKFRIDLL